MASVASAFVRGTVRDAILFERLSEQAQLRAASFTHTEAPRTDPRVCGCFCGLY